MKSKMTKDPTIDLLDTVWKHANAATPHSWERLNHAMSGALSLCIGASFAFTDKTISTVASKYNFGYWCGEDPEWIYTQAIAEGNITAAQSYEAWVNREPFIADSVTFESYHHKYAHMAGGRKRSRLAVGFRFPWGGDLATVTSFSKDGLSLVAVSYKSSAHRDIKRRFTITRDDILAERKDRKKIELVNDKERYEALSRAGI